ncbi:ATP-dependent endonuclease [Lignipirellula cremea]|uniref:ATP-dependent endonuclease n=1 Tax=Lignipirellula cremea TaxID=2528010 RepID=UPI001E36E120|nr:ATP-dependent endonuclease [Lignipirellula cremea]
MRILLVVEGTNDIEFLRRISGLLHAHDPSLPHLADMEQQGTLIFIPFGGGHVRAWMHRLAPLGKPEFHLYDHELPPETDHRREAAEAINRRTHCQAVLTGKRSLENYLHPEAIRTAGEIEVDFDDFDAAAEMVAQQLHLRSLVETPWELLSRRARNRLTHRAKRWLNTKVADQMTVDLLRERDTEGEIASWLKAIGRLADGQ